MKSDRGSFIFLAATLLLATALLIGALLNPQNLRAVQSPETSVTAAEGFELQGGFWRTDHAFRPVLILTNLLETNSLQATPVLYASDGTEFQLPQVNLDAAGVANLDIAQAIQSAPADIRAHFSQYGSVSVRYKWHWPGAIGAVVQNRDAQRSLNYNFDLRAPMTMPSAQSKTVQEGLWWKEDGGVSGFVSLVNVSRRWVDAEIRVLTDSGETEEIREIRLGPRETQSVELLRNQHGTSGGLRVTYDGNVKEVFIAAGLENAHEGYSARIPFNVLRQSDNPETVTLSSTGFMLGTPDPSMNFPQGTIFGAYLALRNITEQSLPINLTLYYTSENAVKTVPLRTLTLGPGESRYLNESEFAAETGLTIFSGIANLIFSYQGGANDLIIADGSIDQKRSFVSELLTRSVGNSQAIGLKDWDVSNGNNTMITVLNLDENDQDFWVKFFFAGGNHKFAVHLKSHESTMLNVGELISNQQREIEGSTMPQDVQHGSAVLYGASGYPDLINVGVSVGIFNVLTATCGNTCPTCFGYSTFAVQSVTSTVPIGNTAKFKAVALGQNGVLQDVSSSPAVIWSSSNSSVANSQGGGSFQGAAAGTFNAVANANLIDVNADCPEGPGHPCPTSPYFGQGPGKIQKPTSLTALTVTVLPTGTTGNYGCTPSSNFGIKVAATYQVLDQTQSSISSSSMEPQETITNQCINGGCSDPVPIYSDIGPSRITGTSKFTNSLGQFTDAPLGICGTGSFTASATQNIRVLLNGTPYSVRLNLFSFSGASSGAGSIASVPDISKSRP